MNYNAVLSQNRVTPVNTIVEKQKIMSVNQAFKKRLYKKFIKTYADISNFITRIG